MPKPVLILMGSDSDFPVMKEAVQVLQDFEIDCEVRVLSVHRAPDEAMALASEARDHFSVIICGAGMAAHLGGAIAAKTTLPVIGVPLSSGALQGTDALHATVQMSPGVPVATVAIDGARNAAILALQILSLADDSLAEKLALFKTRLKEEVFAKNELVQAHIHG